MDNRIQDQVRTKGQGFGKAEIIRTANYNVRSIKDKVTELERTVLRKEINIASITERKKKLKGTTDLDKHIIIYSGMPQNERAKVGITQ